MLTIPETVRLQADAAADKSALLARPGVFAVRAALAGAFIGLGVLVMVTAGGPFVAAGSPAAPLVQGLVFGVALTVVVLGGGELATSTMMVATHGVLLGRLTWSRAGVLLVATLAGNLVGSVLLAALVHVSGVTAPGTAAGAAVAGMLEHKTAASPLQLLVRGVLCNVLVCLAVWTAHRLRSEGARIAVIVGCVAVFVASGFEHVVANMTTFSLGLLGGLPHATPGAFAANLLLVGLGNTVGGALLVGAAYACGSRGTPPASPAAPAAPVAAVAGPARSVVVAADESARPAVSTHG
ncbi:formate/nitrite transporter family protein [Cellulomonas endophytica]|uniref:formate/nitrite transporter family protein n=1 Tax=Cellulomonas endophytica TaxID=2494735 RepID=UPI0010130335|nr:formate/nitrite transporter family protein [Cellulomonas endophytica]